MTQQINRRALLRWTLGTIGLATGLGAGLHAARALRSAPTPQPVEAKDYDAFWLWAGVRPQPVLAKASRIYLLYAELLARQPQALSPRRAGWPRVDHADVWMVIRVETLDWAPNLTAQILYALGQWKRAGSRVVGLQIDFDAQTLHLDRYASFLKTLRQDLPADLGLSITGLMDWATQGEGDDLSSIAGVVDEMVIQSYQGRRTIPDVDRYLGRLDRLPMPFRVGLVQGGTWTHRPDIEALENFRGYVVFLLNQG